MLSYIKNAFYLKDTKSKFGTSLLLQKPIMISNQFKSVDLQRGKFIITLSCEQNSSKMCSWKVEMSSHDWMKCNYEVLKHTLPFGLTKYIDLSTKVEDAEKSSICDNSDEQVSNYFSNKDWIASEAHLVTEDNFEHKKWIIRNSVSMLNLQGESRNKMKRVESTDNPIKQDSIIAFERERTEEIKET